MNIPLIFFLTTLNRPQHNILVELCRKKNEWFILYYMLYYKVFGYIDYVHNI